MGSRFVHKCPIKIIGATFDCATINPISTKPLILVHPTFTVTGALVMRNPDPTIYIKYFSTQVTEVPDEE